MGLVERLRMSYARNVEANIPIGSGVTEAACKMLVKQRLCNSGMRWKERRVQRRHYHSGAFIH